METDDDGQPLSLAIGGRNRCQTSFSGSISIERLLSGEENLNEIEVHR